MGFLHRGKLQSFVCGIAKIWTFETVVVAASDTVARTIK
jgi:hypothetical protein